MSCDGVSGTDGRWIRTTPPSKFQIQRNAARRRPLPLRTADSCLCRALLWHVQQNNYGNLSPAGNCWQVGFTGETAGFCSPSAAGAFFKSRTVPSAPCSLLLLLLLLGPVWSASLRAGVHSALGPPLTHPPGVPGIKPRGTKKTKNSES